MNITIANRLAELRKKNGLSQEDLADKIGLSRQAVSKWERAQASPDTDNLICLAKLYNISLDQLLDTDQSLDDLAKEEKEKQKGESSIDIDSKGIHLTDSDGSQIHIGDGIHLSGKEGSDDELGDQRWKNYKVAEAIVGGVAGLLALIGYLLLGFLYPDTSYAWSTGWILFLFVPVLTSIVDALKRKKICAFLMPVLITAIYVFVGMTFSLWHPLWVLFLIIPIYYMIFDPIDKLIRPKFLKKGMYLGKEDK
ncbi:MAG: helix-turn-helix transcriptional regulator [Bacilli bacterium]